MKDENGLTLKQADFVEAYITNGGNGTEAAIAAGYQAINRTVFQSIATENLCKPLIKKAISTGIAEIKQKTIATRVERQKFWSDVMNDSSVAMSNRLKAAELLGKSEADFTDNLNVTDTVRKRLLNEVEAAEAKRLADIRLKELVADTQVIDSPALTTE